MLPLILTITLFIVSFSAGIWYFGPPWILPKGYKHYKAHYKKYARDTDIVSQRFTRKRVERLYEDSPLDAIVVGSGIGGLTTAALLARCGWKVLVLEQHTIAGGCTHTFNVEGFEFETGVHYIGNIAKRKKILDLITREPIIFDEMDDVYDEVHIGDEIVLWEKGEDKYLEVLYNRFPNDHDAINRIYSLIKETSQKDLFFKLKIVKWNWLRNLLKRWSKEYIEFKTLSSKTCLEVLSEYTDNQMLVNYICSQFGDYGRPDTTSFIMMASVIRHYISGGYYPRGGSREFAKQIIPVIEAAGGAVLTGRRVTDIPIKCGRVTGVMVGCDVFLPCNIVISDAGVMNTYTKLVPGMSAIDFKFDKILFSDYAHSTQFIYLFIGFDAPVEELNLPRRNIWIWPLSSGEGYPDMLDRWYTHPFRDDTKPPLFIAFGSAKDTSYSSRHPETSTGLVLTMGKWSWFDRFGEMTPEERDRSVEYQMRKVKFEEKMLEGFKEHFPHLMDHIVYVDIGTPISSKRYIGSLRGEGYGLDCTPERFRNDNLRPETPTKGLYLTGQDVCIEGFTGALIGGVLCAHSVLGYGTFRDLVRGRNLIDDLIEVS